MCTLVAIHRRVPGAPLVVAANRDEYFDRPSEPPALRSTPCGPVVAPRDLRAGGTWMGLNGFGVFAAVTNRRSKSIDPSRRSRGLVVMDLLTAASATQAAALLESLPEGAYNSFNALVVDAERIFCLVYQETPRLVDLGPGVHVIGNADPNAPDVPKLARVRERAQKASGLPRERVLAELAEACREHDAGGSPLDDTCVHAEGYGTRSSALLLLAESDEESRLLFADGPPCRNEYRDFTPLLRELSETASYASGETATRKAS